MIEEQFAKQEEVQHVITGFENLYNQILANDKVDVEDIKTFIEPYFISSGYRTGGGV